MAAIDESGERIAAIRLLALTGARLSEIANLTHARPNRDHRQQHTGADAETSARLRRSLRAYCHRDTWAMVRLHQALNVLAARSK